MLEEENHKKKLILASASPRRKKILELLKLDFAAVKPGDFNEEQFKSPYTTVACNSIIKAKNVYNILREKNIGKHNTARGESFLIAGFDTVVYINRRILGKPADKIQAGEYLNILSGRVHRVISGVCILESVSGKYNSCTETTGVKFRKLTPDEIEKYINRENVMDKAGAYNVLGYGSILVEKVNGCFYNIAGLPVARFLGLLKEFGFNVIS